MTFQIAVLCLSAGFLLGIAVSKKAQRERTAQLGRTLDEGYFQNILLSGLATILFHRHADDVFEVPVQGVIYKVFQRGKDILYEKKA